jgi:phospholysine phosphohistidine inorganic pyrophosphate phosphatase
MRAILFDMDGVLYDADRPIAGAAETVAWAKHRSIPYLFVTNTTSRDRAALVNKLHRFGIEASEQQIMTPAVALVQWLRQQSCSGPLALFLPPSVKHEFADMPCLSGDVEKGAVAYVVIGDLQDRWDYRTLNRAFRLLYFNPEAKLIAMGMTRYWLASDGISLDVAPFVAALERATGRQPIVFGKPMKSFFVGAAEQLGLAPGDVLMVGDDIETDVGGAQSGGVKGAIVKTGKFRAADLEGPIRPYVVLDSIADLPDWWNEH